MNSPFGFGGIPSPHDYRDVLYTHLQSLNEEAVPIPAAFKVDITALPFDNQKQIGSCIGHAAEKDNQKNIQVATGKVFPLSPRFVYAKCKEIDGNPTQEGTFYKYGMLVLEQYGNMTTDLVPDDCDLSHAQYINLGSLSLPTEAYTFAAQFKIPGYAQLNVGNVTQLQQAIMANNGIMLGVQVGQEWYTDIHGNGSWAAKDVLPVRPPKSVISGHAIYVYGWDTTNGQIRFWFRNSWSTNWASTTGIENGTRPQDTDGGNGYFVYNDYKPFITEGWVATNIPTHIISAIKTLPSKASFKHSFSVPLTEGDRNAEVTALQTALMIDGEFLAGLYLTLLDSNELGYYGVATAACVKAFQEKYKLADQTTLNSIAGRSIGPATRAKLTELFG